MTDLSKRYIITVCMDGFVSIMDRGSKGQRRLAAALPLISVDNLGEAMELISRLCTLSRCDHGKKIGTLIEPRITRWPSEATLQDHGAAAQEFATEHAKLVEGDRR